MNELWYFKSVIFQQCVSKLHHHLRMSVARFAGA